MPSFQVVIIEPESVHSKVLSNVLMGIAPEIEILQYLNVAEFLEAYKKSVSLPESSDSTNSDDEATNNIEEKEPIFDLSKIQLILADLEVTHKVDQNLWKRFLTYLNRLHQEGGIKARFLYTGFDTRKEFDPRDYHSDVVFNILLKPFDPIIVRQTLILALADDGPLRVDELYHHDQPATIELIKDIEIDRLTELGFRTISKRAIEINKVARYFGAPFDDGESESVFAYCYANEEVSKNPPQFLSSFSYLGIPKLQLAAIRRSIQADKDTVEYSFDDFEMGDKPSKITFLLFTRDENFVNHLTSVFEDKFSNVELLRMSSPAQLLEQLPLDCRGEFKEAVSPRVFATDESVVIKFSASFEKILGVEWAEGEKGKPPEVNLDLESLGLFEEFRRNPQIKEPVIFRGYHDGCSVFVRATKLEHIIELSRGKVWKLTVQELNEEEIHKELTRGLPPLKQIEAVFFYFDNLGERALSLALKIVNLLNDNNTLRAKYFLFSDKKILSYQDLDSFKGLDDVFPLPLDIYYLSRKVKMHCPEVDFIDPCDNSRKGVELREGIKTALPLTIDSVSEIHISFKYPRKIRIADVRRLILGSPNAQKMPEILAVCRYCEKLSEGSYQCSFMFFAIQDKQLKHIRQWIKSTYARAKQGED